MYLSLRSRRPRITPSLRLVCVLPLLLVLLTGCRSGPKFTAESRIKQLGQLLTMTLTRNSSIYPDMSSPAALKKSLQPTIAFKLGESGNDNATFWRNEIFVDPQSGQPFMPNARLTGVNFADIDTAGLASETITAYAPTHTNGERLIIFADGHPAWIKESLWTPDRLKVPIKKPAATALTKSPAPN